MRSLLQRAGPGHLGVHYIVTDRDVAVIVTTAQGQIGQSRAVPRDELNRQVAALRAALATPRANPLPAAQALYQTLLAPIASSLDQVEKEARAAGRPAATLVLSLTDVLRYVPFAALHDSRQFVVERFATVLRTEAAGDPAGTSESKDWRVAAFGVTGAVSFADDQRQFAALPAVSQEVGAIVRTAATPSGALPGSITLDAEFSRSALEQALAVRGERRVVHVASHFHFAPGNEFGSYLVLGDKGKLSLADLRELNLGGVELLTLSACSTAVGGGRNERGSEVEGLGASLQTAGARSVIASLWAVADTSTAALMPSFYRSLSSADAKLDTALALRSAQLVLLRGAEEGVATSMDTRGASLVGSVVSSDSMQKIQGWAHPFYWAPFILLGRWQ